MRVQTHRLTIYRDDRAKIELGGKVFVMQVNCHRDFQSKSGVRARMGLSGFALIAKWG